MTPICEFRVTARRVTCDPYRITGSRVRAPNVNTAVDLLLDGLKFPQSKQDQARYDLRKHYKLGHYPASQFFQGTESEWIEAVRRNIIRKHTLTHIVPEAQRYQAPKVRGLAKLEPTAKVIVKVPRMGLLERLENAVGRYPKLWTAFLATLALGTGTWIVATYWQEILMSAFTMAASVALLGYGIRSMRGY